MIKVVSTELVESREKVDAVGRKIADTERRQEVVAGWAKSGLTQRAYAKQEGIKYSTLVHWLSLGRSRPAAPKAPLRFAQVQLGARPAGLEVGLPNGIVIRGGDVAQIAAMIKALGR